MHDVQLLEQVTVLEAQSVVFAFQLDWRPDNVTSALYPLPSRRRAMLVSFATYHVELALQVRV